MVLFVRFLPNTETRVSCSFEFVFLGFSLTRRDDNSRVWLIISNYFRDVLYWFFCRGGLLLAGHPNTPHHMASPLARRFCVRLLSERQFEYLPWWKYCVDFVFHSNGQTRVFYSVYFVFMFLSCTLLVLF